MTHATMASPTGTARMPTQGSWRPLVEISVSRPCRSTVLRGVRIDEVGLTAKRATTGWPVEIPPRMPPALFERNSGLPSLPYASRRHSPRQLIPLHRSRANLDTLDGIDAHQRRGEVGVELAIERRAKTGRHALSDNLDHRADRRAALAHAVEISRPRTRLARRRARRTDCARLRPNPSAPDRSGGGRSV